MVTLDTNVAIYALTDNAEKAETARQIISRCAFASVQILNETASVLSRKRGLSWRIVAEKLRQLGDALDRIVPVTDIGHRRAITVAARYQLQFYDALLIAVAIEQGATTLYSEDMQHGLTIDGTLRIENPFL